MNRPIALARPEEIKANSWLAIGPGGQLRIAGPEDIALAIAIEDLHGPDCEIQEPWGRARNPRPPGTPWPEPTHPVDGILMHWFSMGMQLDAAARDRIDGQRTYCDEPVWTEQPSDA